MGTETGIRKITLVVQILLAILGVLGKGVRALPNFINYVRRK